MPPLVPVYMDEDADQRATCTEIDSSDLSLTREDRVRHNGKRMPSY